jgi:hypothetical protein
MPIIRNTEIRFHRPEFLKPILKKPILKKPNRRAPPHDAGAGTSADAARSQQQARNWRYYFLKTVAFAPAASATEAPPAASNLAQNSDSSSSTAGNRGIDNSANNAGSIVSEQENCRTIDKLRAGASTENIEHILKKGLERLDLLFTPQNLPGEAERIGSRDRFLPREQPSPARPADSTRLDDHVRHGDPGCAPGLPLWTRECIGQESRCACRKRRQESQWNQRNRIGLQERPD